MRSCGLAVSTLSDTVFACVFEPSSSDSSSGTWKVLQFSLATLRGTRRRLEEEGEEGEEEGYITAKGEETLSDFAGEGCHLSLRPATRNANGHSFAQTSAETKNWPTFLETLKHAASTAAWALN